MKSNIIKTLSIDLPAAKESISGKAATELTETIMDQLERLKVVALQQDMSGEFPSWLMAEIMVIADNPDRYADKAHLIEMLITQISNFDLYAGTGCFDTSVGAGTIRTTIRQIVT